MLWEFRMAKNPPTRRAVKSSRLHLRRPRMLCAMTAHNGPRSLSQAAQMSGGRQATKTPTGTSQGATLLLWDTLQSPLLRPVLPGGMVGSERKEGAKAGNHEGDRGSR